MTHHKGRGFSVGDKQEVAVGRHLDNVAGGVVRVHRQRLHEDRVPERR